MREIINCVLRDAGDTEIGEVQEITTQYDVKKRGFGAHGGRVDVRARTADGTLFDIEVQLNTEPAMNARSWFYGSSSMGEEFQEGMQAFATRYRVSLTDPDLKRIYDLEMSAKRDQASAMDHARSEGRAEGRAEGKVEIIRNLLANGVPLDIIYKSASMSRSDIDAVLAQMK